MAAKRGERLTDLFTAAEPIEKTRQLPKSIFGVDLLPQAAEIAKLAIWLRSARRGEKVLDLSSQIIAADSLLIPAIFTRLAQREGSFDAVIGNPPWGGEFSADSSVAALEYLGAPSDEKWDSWELFVLLGLRALKRGGRLAFVLPDSVLYPEKDRIRRLIMDQAEIEKVFVLGPDWFGKKVRMGTVVIQVRRGDPRENSQIKGMLLSGVLRESAILGKTPLTQIESQRTRLIPTARVLSTPSREIEVFRDERDDRIIASMESRSVRLSELCTRGRGEEINKEGLVWVCPSCMHPNTPGKKEKGGGYRAKKCTRCEHLLNAGNVDLMHLVTATRPAGSAVTFIDGDDVSRRYRRVRPNKWLSLVVAGWNYKDAELYKAPKILVRQAGVGISATLDETDSRCPQSMYMYRVNDSANSCRISERIRSCGAIIPGNGVCNV